MSLDSGIASLGGSLISGISGMDAADSSARAQDRTNAANIRLSQQQMEFQERLSSTAIQRARNDARAAGLNPLYALSNPESSPAGSAPHLENPEAVAAPIRADAVNKATQAYTNFTSANNATQQTQSNVQLNSALSAKAAADVAKTNTETAANIAKLPKHVVEGEAWKLAQPFVTSAGDLGKRSGQSLLDTIKTAGQNTSQLWPFGDRSWKDTNGAFMMEKFISHMKNISHSFNKPTSPMISPNAPGVDYSPYDEPAFLR